MTKELQNQISSDLPYQVVLDLDSDKYAPVAKELARLFSKAVDENGCFELEKAIATIKEQPDLALIGTLNQDLKQSRKTLAAMTGNVAGVVESVGASFVGHDKLVGLVEGVFGDLKEQQGKPWFSVISGEGKVSGAGKGKDDKADKTVYTYNLFYATHSPATGSVLAVILLQFRVSTDASIQELLGDDQGEGGESGDPSAGKSKSPSRRGGIRIQYEKHEFEVSVKGLTVVKPL